MKHNFTSGMKKYRKEIGKNIVNWDIGLLTHLFVSSSVTGENHPFTKENGHDVENLNITLLVNGVEVNLEKGLNRLLGIVDMSKKRIAKYNKIIADFNNKIGEISNED